MGGHALGRTKYRGSDGLVLAADIGGDPLSPTVILLPGAGQTRHSWGSAARGLVERGYHVISLDLRGHGDSEWAVGGEYGIDHFAADVRAVAAECHSPPVLVGASLGGLASLMAVGDANGVVARALVLVDIVPRASRAGGERIGAFMGASPEGFASVEEAAALVAAYLPQRKKPPTPHGLMRNLRMRDGRYHWHWDPAFLRRVRPNPKSLGDRYEAAARKVHIPTLLIRGARSEIVTAEAVQHFRTLMPHAACVDISDAHHMVAGDRNDAFNDALFSFLDTLPTQDAGETA